MNTGFSETMLILFLVVTELKKKTTYMFQGSLGDGLGSLQFPLMSCESHVDNIYFCILFSCLASLTESDTEVFHVFVGFM